MRRKFKIEIAREVYQSIMNYGTVSPMALHNACELVGIGMHPKRKNYLLMYFMVKEPYDIFDRNIKPTELELKQSEYIRTHMQDNLKDFIAAMETDIIMDDDRTFDKTQLLDAVFSAADTDGEWSHSEGDVPVADANDVLEDDMPPLSEEELEIPLVMNTEEVKRINDLTGEIDALEAELEALEDTEENKKARTALKIKITKLKNKL